jgi:hypothetical protein
MCGNAGCGLIAFCQAARREGQQTTSENAGISNI